MAELQLPYFKTDDQAQSDGIFITNTTLLVVFYRGLSMGRQSPARGAMLRTGLPWACTMRIIGGDVPEENLSRGVVGHARLGVFPEY